MRAALLTQDREDVTVGEVPDPTITSPDDVIVRVGATGFRRTDIHLWDGQVDAAQEAAGVDLHCVAGTFRGLVAPGGFAELVTSNARGDSADKRSGSWWEAWSAWVLEPSGGETSAPAAPGTDRHPPLEPAPGSYVLDRVPAVPSGRPAGAAGRR
jgi:hypothetical protein